MSALQNCAVTKREPLPSADAKWVKLVKTHYTDPHGTARDWESAERSTRPAGVDYDGVGILAILLPPTSSSTPHTPSSPSLLLQKQFRPPIGKVTIELPAGLVDAGETAEECALRELREETGYHGVVVEAGDAGSRSVLMFNDPGMCNTNTYLIHVTIDLADERNKNPTPQLEDNEFIECFSVPLHELYRECRRLEEQGCAIDARVGTIAEGIEMARRFGV